MVRVHLEVAPHVQEATIDGILVGREAGHLVLRNAGVVMEKETTVQLDGPAVHIPQSRVLFIQVLR
jgi:hypothetical protein